MKVFNENSIIGVQIFHYHKITVIEVNGQNKPTEQCKRYRMEPKECHYPKRGNCPKHVLNLP